MTNERLKVTDDILTERLIVKPLNVSHAEELQKLTNNYEITQTVHILQAPFTIEDAINLLSYKKDEQDCFFGVWVRGMDKMVAVIGVHFQSNNRTEIGYWVHPSEHRKGIAHESLTALLNVINTLYPKRTIIAECRPENKASWRLLEKCGFKDTESSGHRPGRKILIWNKFI